MSDSHDNEILQKLAAVGEAMPAERQHTYADLGITVTLRKVCHVVEPSVGEPPGPTLILSYNGRTHEEPPREFGVLVPVPDVVAIDDITTPETLFEIVCASARQDLKSGHLLPPESEPTTGGAS